MKRCVIIGGAPIANYDRIRSLLRQDDVYLFCDSGLKHRQALGLEASWMVGDFDSYPEPETQGEKIVLPREKDDTDTVFGVKAALAKGYDDFLLIGCVGARLDHTLGNVSLLLYLDSLGKSAVMADDYSLISVISRNRAEIDDSFPYFSLLAVSGDARGVTIRNAKYPLDQAEITCEYAYGISNEVLPGKTAEVTVSEGCLLLIRVFDA